MLELGATQKSAPAGDLIKDVSEANFMAEVVEKSQTVPVIVDFWAPGAALVVSWARRSRPR